MRFLSDHLIVRMDDQAKGVLIEHPDKSMFPTPLVNIRRETYESMSFQEMCSFLGSRLVLLMPELREHYRDEIDEMSRSENGGHKPRSASQ